VIVQEPGATPVVIPVVKSIVATAVLLLVHVPPTVASVKATVTPVQTPNAPDIAGIANEATENNTEAKVKRILFFIQFVFCGLEIIVSFYKMNKSFAAF
jgi:hypothetical protein